MLFKLTTPFRQFVGLGLAAFLSAALSVHADAAETWKANAARSTFSADANTLVLTRYNAPVHPADAKGNSSGTFLVISGGKIYLATDESAAGITPVEQTRWMDMKLVQIGDHVRSIGLCGFRCQTGLRDTRMTLSFLAKSGDPTEKMRDIVVFNAK